MKRITLILFLFFLLAPLAWVNGSMSQYVDPDKSSKNAVIGYESPLKILESNEIKSKEEIFSYHAPGRIRLTIKEMAAFKNWYKQRYKDNEWLGRKFKKAYYNMGAWDEKLKKIFRDEFADTDISPEFAELLRFIAIPESHWEIRPSPVGAYGHYQIMPGTGKDWGMNIGRYANDMKNIDERRDPLASARVCAKYLKKYMLRYSNLYLAINTWNGTYSEQTFKEKNKANLKLFAEFMEKKVNVIREDTNRLNSYQFNAPSYYTLLRTAAKFKVDPKILRTKNNFSNSYSLKRKFGRKTLITISVPSDPLKKLLTRAEIYNYRIRGIKENFTFLPKVFATIELINEGFVDRTSRAKPYRFIGSLKIKQTAIEPIYIVRKNDNVWSIARKFPGVVPREIKDRNHLDKSYKIYPGQKLIIPNKSGPAITLESVAKNLEKDQAYMEKLRANIDLKKGSVYEYLKKINPAIKNVKLPLPNSYRIRI